MITINKLLAIAPPALAAMMVAAAFGGVISACSSGDEGPTMKPGENCLTHHSFSAAGTVFKSVSSGTGDGLAGATVLITDSQGRKVSLTTNSAGNFYTEDALSFPAEVTVTSGANVQTMPAAPNGGCNSCHGQPPSNNAPGRVYAQ